MTDSAHIPQKRLGITQSKQTPYPVEDSPGTHHAESEEQVLNDLESNAEALQELEAQMKEQEENRIQSIPAPAEITGFQFHVCVVASIKGDNVFTDAVVKVLTYVDSAEDINALRNAMAQSVGALPERVTVVSFQYLGARYD